jgi:TnsA endonuclease-like protein
VRRIPLSRRSHITGFRPISGKAVEHESALERDFVTLTSFLDAGAKITSQPVTIWFGEGKPRRYTPDFLVAWSDGRLDLVEIKYRADLRTNWMRLRPGFVAARGWACEHGAKFRNATERAIRSPLLDNAKRLLPLRTAPFDATVLNKVVAVARALPAPTPGQIVAAMPGDRAVAIAAVWRAIARGLLLVDLAAPVHHDTPVRAP